MKQFKSLRSKLTLIYALTIITPFLILAFALPYYAQQMLAKDTEQLTEGTLHALASNIETYLDDLERLTASPYLNDNVIQALKITADNLYDNASAYTKLQTDRALKGTLPNYLINTRRDILSTIIVTLNGKAYMTNKNNNVELVDDFPFQQEDWYVKALEKDGKVAFISPHSQNYLNHATDLQVFSVSRLIKNPESGQPLAVIMADADTHVLEKITKNIQFNVSSVVAILDDHQNIIYANKPLTDSMRQLLKEDHAAKQDSNDYVTVTETIQPANWKMTVFLSNKELQQKVRWIYLLAILLSIGGLAVTFIVFQYFSEWIVKPVKLMNDVMNKVKKGNLQARYSNKGNDELSLLGHSLNNMITQLDDLINREYKAILAQRDAEYRALQSQIQPHFLYNTLSGFIGLNRIGEKQQLEDAIISLSGMLRYILEDNQWSDLKQEFLFLSKYAMLQQIRFQEKLRIDIDYDEAIGDFRIPKLLFQPILENAIIHGIEPDDKQNLITINANLVYSGENSYIRVTIQDDGVGFDADNNDRTGVGILNVRSRMQLVYPEAVLTVSSRIGAGTHVTIMIPQGGQHL